MRDTDTKPGPGRAGFSFLILFPQLSVDRFTAQPHQLPDLFLCEELFHRLSSEVTG